MDQTTPTPSKAKLELKRISDLYNQETRTKKLHALILGDKGSGKTRLAKTCPAPILIHSFDPGGTETLRNEIDKGTVIADTRFEVDSPDQPSAFRLWETEFSNLRRMGVFDEIGTYILDPLSTMAVSAVWQIMKKEGRLWAGMNMPTDDKRQGMRIQDWGVLVTAMQKLARDVNNLPCHTIITCHISREKDQLGRVLMEALLPGQSQQQVPNISQELYVLLNKPTSEGPKRILLTADNGEYRATTRMGSDGKLAQEEPADIRALLKKVGYDWEDKQ